jgi:phage shock protein E
MKIAIFIVVLVAFLGILTAQDVTFQRLSTNDYFELIEQMKTDETEFVLLDIRTQPEFDAGHLEDADMLDFYSPEFVSELVKLDKSRRYLIYCRSGNRTGQTLNIMSQLGFENVSDLQNGINSWIRAGFAVVK